MTRRAQAGYITPLDTAGDEAAASGGDTVFGSSANRGVVTLAAGTYFVPIPCADVAWVGLQTQGDAAIALTSVTLEESFLPEADASYYSDNIGEWLAVDAARITSAAEGTGWTNTSDVIGNAAGNAGAGVQNVSDCAARRMRAKVVVATGGQARFISWGKE